MQYYITNFSTELDIVIFYYDECPYIQNRLKKGMAFVRLWAPSTVVDPKKSLAPARALIRGRRNAARLRAWPVRLLARLLPQS